MDEGDHGLAVIPKLLEDDLVHKQRADPEIREVIKHLESNKGPPSMRESPLELALWFREWRRFGIRNGLLYRKRTDLEKTKSLEATCLTTRFERNGTYRVA